MTDWKKKRKEKGCFLSKWAEVAFFSVILFNNGNFLEKISKELSNKCQKDIL